MGKWRKTRAVFFVFLFMFTFSIGELNDISVSYAQNSKTTKNDNPTDGIIPIVGVNSIKSVNINRRVSGVLITGKRPSIEKLGRPELEKALNEKINSIYNEIIENISEGTKSVTFDFNKYLYGDIISITMTSSEASASSNEKRRSINFNLKTAEIVGINDVLDINGTKVLTKYLTGKIKQTPDLYTTDFTEVTNDSAFYISNGNFVVCFDKYKIAPGAKGIVEFSLPLDNYKSVEVKQGDYFLTSQYNIKMIRLSQVAEAFSMKLKWLEKQNLVEVWRNNSLVSSLTIGQNKYFKGKNFERPLEFAPILLDYRTYVPISYFGEILDVSYTVDKDENILFSCYVE